MMHVGLFSCRCNIFFTYVILTDFAVGNMAKSPPSFQVLT
jgi:hypothetical protein